MVFNLLVLAITLLLAGFLLVWLLFPQVRPWIEAPKYRLLTWEQQVEEKGPSRNRAGRPGKKEPDTP
jgi:hypothetical protein